MPRKRLRKRALQSLTGFACVLAVATPAAHTQTLLGDINGSPTGGVVPAASLWQQYSYSFVASSAQTSISFVFRNEPSYTALDDIALLAQGSSLNLLANGNLEAAGVVGPNGATAPAGWAVTQSQEVGTPGEWRSSSAGAPPFLAHSGSGFWYDGSVGAFDGLTQQVTTTAGSAYTLSFWLGSNLVPNGTTVDSRVYAGSGLPPGQSYWYGPGSSTGSFITFCCTVFAPSPIDVILLSDTTLPTLDGSGSVALGSFTLTLTNASTIYFGNIFGAGNLAITGGAQTLAAVNSYTGSTLIGPGATLILQGGGSIDASSLVTDNGTLDLTGENSATQLNALTGSGAVRLGGYDLIITHASTAFSGSISGNGGLTIAAGRQEFSAANGYTGETTIMSGATLALTGQGSISGSGVRADGTFDISATDNGTSIKGLSGSGGLRLGARDLEISVPGPNPFVTIAITHSPALAPLYIGSIDCLCGIPASIHGDPVFSSNVFTGTVSGSGALIVTGAQQALTGTSTYAGGTALTGAVLGVNSDVAMGAGGSTLSMTNSTLAALADLTIARPVVLTQSNKLYAGGHTVTLDGPISGAGNLLLDGGGRVTLSGSNTYTGDTAILHGTTLAIASESALGGTSGRLIFEKGILLALDSLTIDRTVVVTGGGGLVDANGGTVEFAGPVYFYSLLYPIGAGSVLYTGPVYYGDDVSVLVPLHYAGVMHIPSILRVNDSLTADGLVVDSTGILRGTGTVNAPTTIFGTLAPGNSPGTLTFTAPLTLAPGAVVQSDIDGPGTGTGAGNYSRVVVTGAGNTAALNGTLKPLLRGITGDATNRYTPPVGQGFQVISAEGGVTGSFAALTQPVGLAAGTRFDTLYTPTALSLVVTPASYANLPLAGIPETGQQAAIGRVLDAIRPVPGPRPDAALAALFDPLYVVPGAAVPGALDQLSPGIYGDALMAGREAWYQVADSISAQLASRRGAAAQSATAGPLGLTVWSNGIGSFAHVSSGEAPGYHLSLGGVIAGIDAQPAPGLLAGLAVAGGSLRTTEGSASANATAVQFSVYGGLQSGPWFVDGQASYLHLDQDVRRNLPVWGASTRDNQAANGGGAQLNGGLRLQRGRWRIEPTLGLSLLQLAAASATETTGGNLAESVAAQSITSVQSFAGMRIGTMLELRPGMPLRVHGLLGWTHEFADASAATNARLALAGAGAFNVDSASIGRDAARIGAGFEAPLSPAVSLYGAYEAGISANQVSHNLTGGLRVVW